MPAGPGGPHLEAQARERALQQLAHGAAHGGVPEQRGHERAVHLALQDRERPGQHQQVVV